MSDPRIVDLSRPTISIMKAVALVGVSRRTIYNWHVRIFTDSLFRGPDGERLT
jgi:hypothetical protein